MSIEETLKTSIADIIDKLGVDPFQVVSIDPEPLINHTEKKNKTEKPIKTAQLYSLNYSGKPYPISLTPEELDFDLTEAMKEKNALPAKLIGCNEEDPIYFINIKTGKSTNGFLLFNQIYIEGHGFDDLISPLTKISGHICNGATDFHESGPTYEYKFSIGFRFKTSEEILQEIL
jgi:hypothetical protein